MQQCMYAWAMRYAFELSNWNIKRNKEFKITMILTILEGEIDI